MSGKNGNVTVFTVSADVTADIAVTEGDLKENGYHHESDCPEIADDEPDLTADFRAFEDWHHETHGLKLWLMCQQEPCRQLSDDFRRTP